MAERDPRLDRYIELFNAGEYWASHEALEPLWLAAEGDRREFYRGLIQAAAAMVHHQRGNAHGVRVLAAKAKTRLARCGEVTEGVPVRSFLADWEACLFAGGPAPRIAATD